MEGRIAYGTCRGGRMNQEDCLFLNGRIVQDEDRGAGEDRFTGEGYLAAVCDGMGGHAMGDWASRFVCERLRDALPTLPSAPGEVLELLGGIQASLEREPPRNCGTTIAGAVLRDARVLVFNAGDSRVYKVGPGPIVRLSHDHSLVQTYVDRGELSSDEAFHHPHRNVIDFGLGDIFAPVWAEGRRAVHCVEDELLPGERYLICSDGVHDVLRDEEIAAICGGRTPAQAAAALEAALQGRMTDNTSYIIIAGG